MDLAAVANTMDTLTLPLAFSAVITISFGGMARHAVPGSHQRWLWGGVYRAGMVLGATHNLLGLVVCALQGRIGLAIFSGVLVGFWVWMYYYWAKKNSDDDFWNSFGKKVAQGVRRVAQSLSGSGTVVPVRH